MEKEVVLSKKIYSAEEVAGIILDIIYLVNEGELCDRHKHIYVCPGKGNYEFY